MSIRIGVEMVGGPELEKAMKDLVDAMGGKGGSGNILNLSLKDTSLDVARRMRSFAPQSARGSHVDWHMSSNGKWVHGGENGERAESGRLKRSIFAKPERRPRYLSALWHVGPKMGGSRNDPTGAWYAAIVNFKGGRNGKGKGFMARAIDPSIHVPMLQFQIAKRLLPKAKKIGLDNAAEVAAAVKKANAKFAYKK